MARRKQLGRLLKEPKEKKKKIKRGGKKFKNQSLVIFSANSEGLKPKIESLKHEIKSLNAAIFTIQETHHSRKGMLKIDNYEIFEAIRKKYNGGTILGVNKALNPLLIKDYNEDFELIVVEVKIRNKEIRIITGYGPQENWNETERLPFFLALEEEIIKAELQGTSIIIEMDSNSKLGPDIIPNDPHQQTSNGKLLAGIIERHGLVVANSLNAVCVGKITRRRITVKSTEESIIDHIIISTDLVKELESVFIDEDGQHALTKIAKTKVGTISKQSDHNSIITKFNISWKKQVKSERVEIYNLKNREGQNKFKELTNKNEELTKILENEENLDDATDMFITKLDKYIKQCFNKIRITDKPNKVVEELFIERKNLRNKTDNSSLIKLKNVEDKLAELCSQSNYTRINDEISNLKCDEGGINVGKLWKLKKKLSPTCRDPPTAMLGKDGNIITSSKEIEELALEVFEERLKNRAINDELSEMKKNKEELCELRLRVAKQNKTPEWKMKDLEIVLRNLKNNKSRDPFGYINELFKGNTAGKDLKLAILTLMNRIKTEQKYPKALEIANITSIYKNKGPKNNFDSYRGIFRVPILRTILDRLIYNDEYNTIDKQMSDSNVGARKGRNVRDNIFTLNAIINSVVNGKEQPIDIQLFDIEKCFDSLWVEECVNDIFESGLKNDKLPLLYMENQNAEIAVKSQTGMSMRKSIKNIIMQGTVWGSLLCTVSMDKLGKHIYKKHDLIYKYKGEIDIPSLGMVDDILAVKKCNNDTVKINAVINSFVEAKKLKLSKTKCHKIHIEKKPSKENQCAKLKIHNDEMKESDKQKYLGDFIDRTGKIGSTIDDRKNKGYGMAAEIIAIVNDIPLGQFKMEISLKLREAMLISGLLFNSEAWHNVSETEIRKFEVVDEHLLRSLVGAHAKTPLEFLYLETGSIPIRFILSCRRMIYLQTILKRSNLELTKRIYMKQKESPTKGDFYCMVVKDFEMIGKTLDETEIMNTSKYSYKKEIKQKIRNAALSYLTEKQQKHSKIRNIKYEKLTTQEYLTSSLFRNNEVNLLFALRSRCIECKANFRNKHDDIACQLCFEEEENQQHLLKCKKLNEIFKSQEILIEDIEYNDIFKDIKKQKVIVSLFKELLEVRNYILNHENRSNPSILDKMLEKSYDVRKCIVNFSSGT